MAAAPTDFPVWIGHGLNLPVGVEARKGMMLGREIIVFYRPSDQSYSAVTSSVFRSKDLQVHLDRMEAPTAQP